MSPQVDPAVDAYLEKLADAEREALGKLRAQLRKELPDADEGLSYGMPAFKRGKSPIAGYGARAGYCFFAPMSGDVTTKLAKELKGYETTKGMVKFDAAKGIPRALLRKLLEARLAEMPGAPRPTRSRRAPRAPGGTRAACSDGRPTRRS